MKKAKRLMFLFLALTMVTGVMAGCGTSAPASEPSASAPAGTSATPAAGEKVTLKLFHNWVNVDEAPYFEDLAKEFESTHSNVDIQIQNVGDPDFKSKLKVMMGAADSPDIFFSWSGEFAYKFIRAGSVWDMTDYVNKDTEWKNSFVQAALKPFTLDGKLCGIPVRLDSKMMVYNKKIWAEQGIEVPKTFEEFLAACQKFKDAGILPIALGNQDPWATCHYLSTFNAQCVPEDVRLKDYNFKTGEFTDPGYVQALNMLLELNDKGYFTPNTNSMEFDAARADFLSGKAAMTYMQAIEFKHCVESNIDAGVFSIPAPADAKGNKDWVTGSPDGFMISSKCKNPEVAMELLKLITTKPWQEKMITQLSSPASVMGVHSKDNSNQPMLDTVATYEKAGGFANWLDSDIHSKIAEVYLPGMQDMLNHSITAEELMAKVQQVAKTVQTEAE